MIITDLQTNYPDCLRSEADEFGLTRSPGLHLTTIIRDIERTIKPKDEWCTEEELAMFGAMGFMWERVFGMAHRDSIAGGGIERMGEFERDGIIGSPDLVRTSDWTLIETKCTWRSVKKWESFPQGFWAWIVQTKAYCHMVGSEVAEIHAFFVAGDWRPPVPCTRSIRIKYTERELVENWKMLMEHAAEKGWL